MRGATLIVAAGAVGLFGCAAVFRDSKPKVHVESDPPGADVVVKDAKDGKGTAPFDIAVPRGGLTEVRANLGGFEEHHGTVRKRISVPWLLTDLATCIVPVLICVPLLVDSISGAWYDVEPRYRAHLVPLAAALAAYAPNGMPNVVRPTATSTPTPTPTPAAPVITISESERKASARAAYQEGMELQSQKSYSEALGRFQYAQRMYDAPTHHLHIAQCLVMTGKLVEAQESYELLTHRDLAADAPAPFREAVEIGKRELADLQPRIPTLRIEVSPPPSTLRNLVLLVNGRPLPNEVIGIARPINPGAYRITATAWGSHASSPIDITLQERNQRAVEVKLGR